MDVSLLLYFPPFCLDPVNEQLWRDKQEIPLRRKTFAVLRYLVEHPQQLVTKEALLNAVWPETIVSDVVPMGCIRDLRKVLGDDVRTPRFIQTVHRRGYRFIGGVVSSQHSEISREEPSANEQNVDSVMPAQVSVQDAQTPTFTHPLWVSVPVAMTQFPEIPHKPSIIVLPFTNMSEDPKQEYFSDGITEELTSGLSRLPSLFVIARHSAFTYKGKAVKVQEVSREMGVRYLLEGSVRKAGDQLRITAQLIDGTTGGHVWSERYDRQLRDVFALQDEITQQIVVALRAEIGKAELTRVRRVPTENLTAYDFYLRGLASSLRVDFETKKEENTYARQMFAKAIELDSMYAEAYVGLGWTYYNEWFFQWAKDRAHALEQALEIARQAVALEDSLPGSHRLLGVVYLWKKQYAQAIVEVQQAIVLDPNDAESHGRLGIILLFTGQKEKSIEVLEKAIRLNPHSLFYFNALGLAQLVAGRHEEALASLQRLLARNPNMMIAYVNIAICYVELGRLEEARAAGVEVLRLNPNWSLEFIKHAPWQDPAIVERHVEALRKVGLK